MSKLVITTAVKPQAQQHLRYSVLDGVPAEQLRPFALPAGVPTSGRVFMWGSVPGQNGRLGAQWSRIEPDDWLVFNTGGQYFRLAGRITATTHDRALADAIWGEDDEVPETYEYVIFLEDIREIDLASGDLRRALGYGANYLFRGFGVPADAGQRQLTANFGSVKAFINDAHQSDGVQLSLHPRREPRPFDPSRRPASYVAGTEHADPEETRRRREKATHSHHDLLVSFSKAIKAAGWTELREFDDGYDLRARAPDGTHAIFEMKTVGPRTERPRVRAALAQLLEYRHFDGDASDRLCLVVDHALSTRRVGFLGAQGISVSVRRPDGFVSQGERPLISKLASPAD
jgi:hypothetical protein